MMSKNIKLMQSARASLDNKWGLAIGAFFIYAVIISISSYASFIVAGPFCIGLAKFYEDLKHNDTLQIKEV